ncbi:MAG TPA: glycosyltransferase family 39 protein [Methylomirabilota bacterium]|nr:glycosyltransferase family 39 protein [Methylomirabilota bacterium]
MSASPSRGAQWAVVTASFLVIALAASVWLALDRRPPEWDHANHLERAVRCAQDLDARDVRAILERSTFYPPLVPCAAAVVYRLAPSDAAAAQAVILGFLGLGMVAVYLLGRRLVSDTAGVVAAVVYGTAPFVLFSALRFQLDLPLAAMVTLGLLAILATEGWRRTGASVLAGLVFGLGMLTKPPFAAYVLPAVLWVLLRERSRRALGNAALAAAVALVLALPWYGPRVFGLPLQIANRSFKNAVIEGKPEPLTWAGLTLYPAWLLNQLGLVAVALMLVGIAVALWRRQGFLLVALLAPFAIFMALHNKDLRYTLPLLPVAAVLAGLAFEVAGRRAQAVVGVVIVAAGLLQLGGTLFAVPPAFRLPGIGVPWVLASRPMQDDWRQRQVLALIAGDSAGAPSTVAVVPNFDFFSVSNFRYYALRDGLPLRFTRAWDDEPIAVDYMVLKSGHVGPSWTEAKIRRVEARLAEDPYLARVYPVIGEFPLPDGSLATVRARRVPGDLDVAPAVVARAVEEALRRRAGDVAREVDDLKIALTYDDEILRGRIRRVEMTAAAATFAEFKRRHAARLRLRDIRIVVDDLLVNPLSAHAAGRLDVLDAGRLRLEAATALAEDLRSFVRELKGFRRTTLAMGDGAVDVTIAQAGPDVRARLWVEPSTTGLFALRAGRVRVGAVPIPEALVTWVVRQYDPMPRVVSRLPFPVDVGGIVITPQSLRIMPR